MPIVRAVPIVVPVILVPVIPVRMILAEKIEQAAAPAAPMAAIFVCRLIRSGKDDDTPLRRIHRSGPVVTGLV